jgi:hypothetical protein
MTLRFANISARGDVTNDVELDARTCECCTTGMAMTRRGPVIVYRDRSPDEMRDIAYVRPSEQPKLLHRDGWRIDGCPVNGPQIDAMGDRAVVAWYTGANGSVHVAWSDDSGTTFGAPVKVDDGRPVGRVDVVLVDDNEALVTWLEQSGEIRARSVERSGAMQPSMKIASSSTARAAGFTRMARVGRDVYFAWTGQQRVHVARLNR